MVGNQALEALGAMVSGGNFTRVGILVDEHTREHCLPRVQQFVPEAEIFSIPSGEPSKNLRVCEDLWDDFLAREMDRKSVLINLGGGVVGDLGGFAAAAFKRGMYFIQVPTTLLAMVDASIGGKTGVDFRHLKNLIGFFKQPEAIFIDPAFLSTLPRRELLSGFAEVVKHCLIADEKTWQSIRGLKNLPLSYEYLVEKSVEVKARIVREDPHERGARKALNFGHTAGHALETWFLRNKLDLTHGEAVAIGMVAESYLSFNHNLLSNDELNEITRFILCIFGKRDLPEKSLKEIAALALMDKKNEGGTIMCTFLQGIGHCRVNQAVSTDEVAAGLEFYQSLSLEGLDFA